MTIESESDLRALRHVGSIVAQVLAAQRATVRPGVTTAELDRVAAEMFQRHGARSAPQLFYNFPGVTCISVNDEAVHGIPGQRALRPGDIVKLDVTAEKDGYIADAAVTVILPPEPPRARQLASAAEAAFWAACRVAVAGRPVSAIGDAIEPAIRRHGFRVLVELHSHGVGRAIHEEPSIPNYRDSGVDAPLAEGQVVTLEPIVAISAERVKTDSDGWTVRTRNGSLAAHFEHTLVITRGRPTIVTAA